MVTDGRDQWLSPTGFGAYRVRAQYRGGLLDGRTVELSVNERGDPFMGWNPPRPLYRAERSEDGAYWMTSQR